MANAVCQVPLPTLVDLSLGTPEVGAINFNILHSLLHIIIKKIDLEDLTVEFRGDDSMRVKSLLDTSKGKNINLTEYAVTPDGKKFVKGRPPKRGRSTLEESEIKSTVGSKSSMNKKSDSGTTIMVIEPTGKTPKMTVAVSQDRYLRMEKDVGNLKQKLKELTEMPANSTVVEQLKKLDDKTPITDLWQALNVTKRMDAVEEGMDKLSSMMEDFIKTLEIPADFLKPEGGAGSSYYEGSVVGDDGGDDDDDDYDDEDDENEDEEGRRERRKRGGKRKKKGKGSQKGKIGIEDVEDEDAEDDDEDDIYDEDADGEEAGVGEERKRRGRKKKKKGEKSGEIDEGDEKGREGGRSGKGGKGGKGASAKDSIPTTNSGRRSYGSVFGEIHRRISALEMALTDNGIEIPVILPSASGIITEGGIEGSAEKAGEGRAPGTATTEASRATMASKATIGTTATKGSKVISKMGSVHGSTVTSAIGGRSAGGSFSLRDEIIALRINLDNLEAEFKKLVEPFKDVNTLAETLANVDMMRKKCLSNREIGEMDSKEMGKLSEEFQDKLNNIDENFNNQINQLQMQMIEIEKELGDMLEKINLNSQSDAQTLINGSNVGIGELFDTITKLQYELQDIQGTTRKITEEAEEKQQNMDQILEELELLKTTKADREDLEDALADKADAFMINRKVSHDQFDAACDDLTKGIEDAFLKLTQQEAIWQSTLEEIQNAIGNKLDRLEFDPLKDFVNNKISKLQEKLKALIALKKEQEAAGSKSKLLRNINCISCDKDVVMRKFNEIAPLPSSDPLPGHLSMRPYLTYELDAVRKQKKCLPHGRNMHHLENALQEEKEKTKRERQPAKGIADHLCNRYCGGSHTVTTPHQRVTRIGHFLTQWGPEAIPLQEGIVLGKDGQVYKGRGITGAPGEVEKKASRISAAVQTSRTTSLTENVTGSTRSDKVSLKAEKDDGGKISEKVSSKSAKVDSVSKKSGSPTTGQTPRTSKMSTAGELSSPKTSKVSAAGRSAGSIKGSVGGGSAKGSAQAVGSTTEAPAEVAPEAEGAPEAEAAAEAEEVAQEEPTVEAE